MPLSLPIMFAGLKKECLDALVAAISWGHGIWPKLTLVSAQPRRNQAEGPLRVPSTLLWLNAGSYTESKCTFWKIHSLVNVKNISWRPTEVPGIQWPTWWHNIVLSLLIWFFMGVTQPHSEAITPEHKTTVWPRDMWGSMRPKPAA